MARSREIPIQRVAYKGTINNDHNQLLYDDEYKTIKPKKCRCGVWISKYRLKLEKKTCSKCPEMIHKEIRTKEDEFPKLLRQRSR